MAPDAQFARTHAKTHPGNDAKLGRQRPHQVQGEVTMGDRAAEWAFAFCAFDIDMDPLPIAGAGRELIDAVLTDRNPF
jgi:hypothetical protein